MTEQERGFYLAQRDAMLRWVDATERLLQMEPRTAELREWYKRGIIESRNNNEPAERRA